MKGKSAEAVSEAEESVVPEMTRKVVSEKMREMEKKEREPKRARL